eukprot:c52263_g1_i1.p1 GENE.c52263_g1_i1~~c52263_g1_i1.p1  ORF type:complete len:182 (-),score=53.94 c52263_g1_i1:45-548(-)
MIRRAFGRTLPLLRAAEAKASTSDSATGPLKLNFFVTRSSIYSGKEVLQVDIPGEAGDFGVLANHVPTVAAMKFGVLTVYESADKVNKFFVSGGFALVHKTNVADIAAVEAVKIEDLDAELVNQNLTSWTEKAAQAKSEEEKAQAELAIEVHRSMLAALASGGSTHK